MSDGATTEGPTTLERELDAMLSIERFEPPEEFRAQALLSDPSVYEEAERDPQAWWAEQAEALDWFERWDTVLDDSNPPFYKWFTGGKLNASYNCLDRHVEAGRGERVAFHWRGEEGEERDITYAELLRDVQRFANALKDLGVGKGDVVGIYLPMIPEVVVAMLACARIGAPHNVVFGGFSAESVQERMEFSEAKALITVDGARRKGKTAPIKAAGRRGAWATSSTLETIVVVRHTGDRLRDARGARRLLRRGARGRRRRVPGRAARRRAPAVHPLHVRLDGQAEGHPAHHRRLPDGRRVRRTGTSSTSSPESDVYWCSADVGWVTGHSYIVYGPLCNGATSRDVRGRARLPAQGHLVGAVRALRRDDLLHRADGDPRVHEVGRRVSRASTTSPRCACSASVGEPINPKAWLWYHKVIGGERCPIVDTWWQTETGAIMITPLPGDHRDEAGLGDARRSRASTPRSSTRRRASRSSNGQGLLVLTRPWPAMLRTLYKEDERFVETYFARFGTETYLVGDAARRDHDGYFWIDRAHRRRHQRLRPPPLDGRGRVGDRRAPEGRRGGRDRPVRRGHRPGDRARS